jgi:hypothetical protein
MRREGKLTLGGLHRSQTWTGCPFLALLTRPVTGVYLTCGCELPSAPLEVCLILPDDEAPGMPGERISAGCSCP